MASRLSLSNTRSARPAIGPALAAVVLCLGCTDEGVSPALELEVRAPIAGEVIVDGVRRPVDPVNPARFPLPIDPATITFIGDDAPLTIVDYVGAELDLNAFLDRAPPIRGARVPLAVQPVEPEGVSMVVIADTQRFAPRTDGETWRFEVPAGEPLVVLAVWSESGRASHLTRWTLQDAALTTDQALVMPREVPLDRTLAVSIVDGQGGRLSAELTEEGVRTGLYLAAGWVEQGRALGVPRGADPSPSSGAWVELDAGALAAADAPPRLSASLPLSETEAALERPTPSVVVPPPRRVDEAAWIDRELPGITLERLDEAAWVELSFEARGLCTPRSWRVIAPAAERIDLPAVSVPDVFDAPLVEARVDIVSQSGAPPETLWRAGVGGQVLPRYVIERRRASVDGFWRTETADCAPHPQRGRYAFTAPDDPCGDAAPARQAVITRCGAFAVLDDERAPDRCGALVDGEFVGPEPGAQPLELLDDGLAWPVVGGRMRLFTLPEPSARPPADRVGRWPRWTLSEQALDAEGRPLADPLVVGGSDGGTGAAVWIDARGELAVRTPRWAFDAVLLSADPDAAQAQIITGGCATRTDRVTIDWSDGVVRVVGTGPDGDGLRRRTLVVSR